MNELPFRAAILDLDGVLTRTARLHAKAWKETFDAFLAAWSRERSDEQPPFDADREYREHVDGKPRYDGVAAFLASRGIELPWGDPDDDAGRRTVCGIGNAKNRRFRELVREEGVEVFEDARRFVERCRKSGMATALITSSRNGRYILEQAGMTDAFDVVIDGADAAERELAGKPAPDVFLAAAEGLGVEPSEAVVVEDAVAGVQAACEGEFGMVVGVARNGGEDLDAQGADAVVRDLDELDLARSAGSENGAPSALDRFEDVARRIGPCRVALFLDYDGTLTPIVDDPDDARLAPEMRARIQTFAAEATVAVVSGRDLQDVRSKVGIEDLVYAGSHGYDIAGPGGMEMRNEQAEARLDELDASEEALRGRLGDVSGVAVERKRYAIAVHYRKASDADIERVRAAVEEVGDAHEGLRVKGGKAIFELQPDVDWHKGRAVRWLLGQLGLDRPDVVPIYVGDDVTDEDAFAELGEDGIGIRVGPPDQETAADFVLRDPDELGRFLDDLKEHLAADHRDGGRRMEPWKLSYTAWTPGEQALREALCALGNGHIVTRGAFEEARADGVHYPGTYVAGGYNRRESEVSGRILENEDLVNWPNWLPLTFRHDGGDWFDLQSVELLDFAVRLDVRRGVLVRRMRFRDAEGRTSRLSVRRWVHMSHRHLAGISWTLEPLDWTGEIEIRSGLDGSVVNGNVERYRDLASEHLEVVDQGWEADDGMYLTVRTSQSLVRMTQAARTRVYEEGEPAPVRREREASAREIAHRLYVTCHERKALRVEKIVSIRTGFDDAISETGANARKDIRRAARFDALEQSHASRWRHLWSISDIELQNGDDSTQLLLRLHIFHILQTVSPNTIDRDVGVPARGWHGEAYRGHIFWDELFIFPTLLLRIPEICRSILMYRYRRLGEARWMARDAGYEGAMFPWQSGSDGREESQVLHLNPESGRWLSDTTHRQRHVNAAIAYNVWTYFQATGDIHFLAYYGAELILEIARFFASLATFDAERGRWEIRGVVGPDEFHTDDPRTDEPGLRNNAYTNVMAAWTLRIACTVLDRLDDERRSELREALHLRDEELVRWDRIGRKLFVPFHGDGIVSQFEGYEDLKELDWERYREAHGKHMRLDRVLEAEGDDVNRYQASKQADVLMLLYLFPQEELEELFAHLGYSFDDAAADRNIAYYLQRTAHGSTLSRMVYAWILARRDRRASWSLWTDALRSDIDDVQGGTTSEGIHLGAMAGTVDLVHRGHAGLAFGDDALSLDPMLPDELSAVRMRIRYRHHWLTLEIGRDAFHVSLDRGPRPAIRIRVRGEAYEMEQGDTRAFAL